MQDHLSQLIVPGPTIFILSMLLFACIVFLAIWTFERISSVFDLGVKGRIAMSVTIGAATIYFSPALSTNAFAQKLTLFGGAFSIVSGIKCAVKHLP